MFGCKARLNTGKGSMPFSKIKGQNQRRVVSMIHKCLVRMHVGQVFKKIKLVLCLDTKQHSFFVHLKEPVRMISKRKGHVARKGNRILNFLEVLVRHNDTYCHKVTPAG